MSSGGLKTVKALSSHEGCLTPYPAHLLLSYCEAFTYLGSFSFNSFWNGWRLRHINDICTHVLFIQVHSSWSPRVNSVTSDYYGFSQVYFIPVTYEHLCWLVFTMSGFCHFGNLSRQHFSSVTVTFQKLSIYKQTTPSGSVTMRFSGS